jgi:hypothetical protein
MRTNLFTVIVEVAGGTYIGQVSAIDADQAFTRWIDSQTDIDLAAWKVSRGELTEIACKKHCVALEGLLSVWCISASISSGLLLANIVLTSE